MLKTLICGTEGNVLHLGSPDLKTKSFVHVPLKYRFQVVSIFTHT